MGTNWGRFVTQLKWGEPKEGERGRKVCRRLITENEGRTSEVRAILSFERR